MLTLLRTRYFEDPYPVSTCIGVRSSSSGFFLHINRDLDSHDNFLGGALTAALQVTALCKEGALVELEVVADP